MKLTQKVIILFDRDVKDINRQIEEPGADYRHWGNNVYSILIPVPAHRGFNEVCIEHYYLESELKRFDSNQRRIFSSDEFNKETGAHITELLTYKNIRYLRPSYPRIIDSGVEDSTGQSVALSKSGFADYVSNDVPPFNDFTFAHFKQVFQIIEQIVSLP